MLSKARFSPALSSASAGRPFTHSREELQSLSTIHPFPPRLRCSQLSLSAAFLVLVIVNPVLAPCQKTTSQSTTLQYEYKPKTPYPTNGLSFAFPTVGLFIGVSDYGEAAKVTSTPAHALGAAVMYDAFVNAATRSENKAIAIPAPNYFKGGESAICALVFSPDAMYFASGSKDGTVKIWSGTRPGLVVGGTKHKDNACAAAFSPDSTQLVTGGGEGDAVVQPVADSKAPITLKHPAGVCSVAFSPNGSKILTTSLDGTTRVWEPAKTQEPLALPPEQDCPPEKRAVQSCADAPVAAFGSNENTVVTSSCSAVRLWSLDKPGESKLLGKHTTAVNSVSFSPDGTKIVSSGDDGVFLWRVDDTTGQSQIGRSPNGRIATISPDGTLIANADATGFIRVYKIPSMKEAASLGGFRTPVKSMQFSQNSQYLLIAAKIGGAWMLDLNDSTNTPTVVPRPYQSGQPDFTIKFAIDQGMIPSRRESVSIDVAALRPDANFVAAGYEDGSVGVHPGLGGPERRPTRPENQVLLGDMKFDNTATSIMAIWYLEQLDSASQELHYHDPSGGNTDDPSFLRLGSGEPVTRGKIFAALSAAIQKAEQTARLQEQALLVVYVAAHGWIGPDGRQYLLPSDADASNPSTWIAYEDFLHPIKDFLTSDSPTGRVLDPKKGAIVIFDTCQIFLGSSQKTPVMSTADDPINLTVIESTSPGQYAWHWTGNLKSTELTTTVKSTSKFGLTHNSGPQQANTKSDYSARMSIFPYASQWALNALIQDRGTKFTADERRISLAQWIANTQEAVRLLQNDIPEVKETGHVQTIQFRNPKQPDYPVFEVDKNAPSE
jgi:WD40 repeat protein